MYFGEDLLNECSGLFFFPLSLHFVELLLFNIFSTNIWALGQPAVTVINSRLVTVMWPSETNTHTVALSLIKTHDSEKSEKQPAVNSEAFLPFTSACVHRSATPLSLSRLKPALIPDLDILKLNNRKQAFILSVADYIKQATRDTASLKIKILGLFFCDNVLSRD